MNFNQTPWTLIGWRPYSWRLGKSMETGWSLTPDIAPLAATLPGSVQNALLEAGVLEDWNLGLNSRDCEWVEHRHWDFTTTVPAGSLPTDDSLFLVADGLDFSGWILVDGCEVGAFSGSQTPHEWDLTAALGDGAAHQLSLVFDTPPEEQGQIGYTSLTKYFKPRYNFSWDWCPRLVPIGVWDSLRLETGTQRAVQIGRVQAVLAADNTTGKLHITLQGAPTSAQFIRATLMDEGKEVASYAVQAGPGQTDIVWENLWVQPWWPHGSGPQKLYDLELEASEDGAVVWTRTRRVGFKRIEWEPCAGAPVGAEPWICVVNGQPTFLQGVNWTPARLAYHDTTAKDYQELVRLYQEMGCNTLRVWGGAFLEKQDFYDACDEGGMLVWQEFPLSSSGIDNWPPEEPEAVRELHRIAVSFVKRRRDHVSLLLWCGGNELQGALDGGKVGIGKPVGYDHPAMLALAEVVEREDAGRRFLPASASGPRFNADAKEYGKGLHHDVHGPWGLGGMSMEEWRSYWENDDSLFRSEVGMPGAQSLELMRKYAGKAESWPPTNALWHHSSAWWTQWDRFREELGDLPGDEALAIYVQRTQQEQADALLIAAGGTKARFPACGGFLLWMGHDCFPCLSNTSVIDFDRQFKPAAYSLQQVFVGTGGNKESQAE